MPKACIPHRASNPPLGPAPEGAPKQALFEHLALIARGLASAARLELLDVLAQGERNVEDLARTAGLSIANTSKHLQQGHVLGALNVPLDQLESRLSELPEDREVVAYCRGPWCVLSCEAAARLRAARFQARRLRDGLPEWRRAGLPVDGVDLDHRAPVSGTPSASPMRTTIRRERAGRVRRSFSPRQASPGLLLWVLLLLAANALAADWMPTGESERQDVTVDLAYAKHTAVRPSDGKQVTAHLAFFTSRAFRLEVIDLGSGPEPAHPTLEAAFRAEGCVAGVNGGFFHPDWQPAGLVMSKGERINRFETAKLLSGVIYSDERGIHLVRRGRFQDHPGITALLQSGPYLVENARPVRGLSASDPRRRTFVATDWRGHWVIGATMSSLTLAELGAILASPDALTPWRVDRAINLDGGSSTGFFFDRGADRAPVTLQPWKRVRNLLGICPR